MFYGHLNRVIKAFKDIEIGNIVKVYIAFIYISRFKQNIIRISILSYRSNKLVLHLAKKADLFKANTGILSAMKVI